MQFLLLLGAIVYADHSVLIDFENRIETCIAKEKLWNELEIAMYRSEDTWLWPNESSVVKGEGLLEAGEIAVTYSFMMASPTYHYRLQNIVPNQSFDYLATKEHPFEGGASINLLDKDGAVVFLWQGSYLIPSDKWLQKQIFRRFNKRFFRQLEKNIHKAEADLCF
tara:strand:+ start:3295 stop:3792 length:498 start_codon:yes stop_codon:yes gene_type:complete